MSSASKSDNPVYSKQTIEFVAVAKSYCDFMDQLESLDRSAFLDTATRLLPLLYLKGSLLPEVELLSDEEPETFATEDQYAALSESIAFLLGPYDAYLEVFHPDIRYSDTPVAAFISENMADIWQDLFNFISVFRIGYEETMHDALFTCREHFSAFWGQTLVNVLRALHHCRFSTSGEAVFSTDEEDFE